MDEVLTTSKLVIYFSKIKFMEQYYNETFNINIFIYILLKIFIYIESDLYRDGTNQSISYFG